MDKATIERNTNETQIKIKLCFNHSTDPDSGSVENKIDTGIGFLDHMLNLFAFRAGARLYVKCDGDIHIDGHHTVEDVGIALGQAILQALGNKNGINRYGEASIPMDESLARCVLDISGRPFLVFNANLPCQRLGDFETELTEEFFRAVAFNAGITLHLSIEYGKNTHHMIEAMFKAFGAATKQAIQITGSGIPSTKGIL